MAHLILQAPFINQSNIETIAGAVNANGVQQLTSPTAVRLLDVNISHKQTVQELCERMRMDYAFIENISKLSDMKILAMDMDSTLINIECIDEIADIAGRKEQVAAITEAAMRGEIKDFSESLNRRVQMLEGVPEDALERVYEERLQLNPGADKLISTARRHGLKTLLVSGGFTFFTNRLKERLNIDYCYANTLEVVDGKLTGKVLGPIVDGAEKARLVRDLANKLGANKNQTITVGDGANDLLMMAESEYCVAYRAKPVVQQQANYALNFAGLDAIINWFRLS